MCLLQIINPPRGIPRRAALRPIQPPIPQPSRRAWAPSACCPSKIASTRSGARRVPGLRRRLVDTRGDAVNTEVVLQRTTAKRMFAASELPSAKTPCRDILFPALSAGLNPAELGPSGVISEPRAPARRPFRVISVSLGQVFLTQPNHARFGTDVGSGEIQGLRESPKGSGLKTSRSAGVNRDRTVRFSVSVSGRRADLS
jgi:hypothetical protein